MTARIAGTRGRTRVARYAEGAALFRTAQMRRDQNSAGRYPLISRPMQISTSVGVVQAIGCLSLAFPSSNKLERGTPSRKPPQHHTVGSTDAAWSAMEFCCRPGNSQRRTERRIIVPGKPIRCPAAAAISFSHCI